MNKGSFSTSHNAPSTILTDDTDKVEMPRSIVIATDTIVKCPSCGTKTTVTWVGQFGPYALGYHNKKLYLSPTQFVEAECTFSGSEIKTEDPTSCPPGCDHKYNTGCVLSCYDDSDRRP